MRWKPYLLLAIALTLGCGVLVFYWKVIQTTQGPPPAAVASAAPTRHLDAPEVTYVDPSLGPKDAKNTIVEFGDYLCPYCKDGQAAIDQLLQARPTDVRFVWKNDPSPLHPGAADAAEAAMCADKQGAFWTYHRKLFDSQETFDQSALLVTATDLNLDANTFGSCLSNHDAKPLVDRTVEEGGALGIKALPTYFIDGKRYEGQLTYDELLQAIAN
jgi:protein-disulfide isomerase